MNPMGQPMHIAKAEIIAALEARGLSARAGWVDRALPRLVDTNKNRSLLQMLDIDPASMSPVDTDVRADPEPQISTPGNPA
jgi:hypothetical protein